MTEKPHFYRLQLESYSSPRYLSATSPYYGTIEELKRFMAELSKNMSTAIRYQEIIDAVSHIGADSPANPSIMLTPVNYLIHKDFVLENHRWTHRFLNGAVLACAADRIEYTKVLLESPQGLDLAIKARFVGLRYCLPGIGWISPEDNIHGFPGVFTWDGIAHTMNLYACNWVYVCEHSDIAYQDIEDSAVLDLDACICDLVGEV